MTWYVIRRLGAAVVLLLITSLIVFMFIHIAPGSPETILLGGRPANPATVAAIRAKYHLNDGIALQYWLWLTGVLHGNLGDSIIFHQSVGTVVGSRILPTFELGLLATVLVFFFGLSAGLIAAVRRGRLADHVVSTVTIVAASFAPYVSAILLIAVFAVSLRWFPVFGLGQGGLDRVYHLALPAIALAASLIALIARVTRASMGHALDQEYVQTARSRGFSEWRVVGRHALRNALVPVLTISGLVAGYLISGAVLVEYTFGLNGLGSLLIQAVQEKDFAVVQAVTLIFTAAFLVINLVVDLLYGVVDPRVRLTRGTD
jgi:peptide/nickel transport system permease protein